MGKGNYVDEEIIAAPAQRGGAGLGILQRSVHVCFPKALGSGFWPYLQVRKQKLRDVLILKNYLKSMYSTTR